MEMQPQHLLIPHIENAHTMKDFYRHYGIYPTSVNGDIALIRSHIAYWSGFAAAERAVIKASRGNSYRVNRFGQFDRESDFIVKIIDYYDHREGVSGYK